MTLSSDSKYFYMCFLPTLIPIVEAAVHNHITYL